MSPKNNYQVIINSNIESDEGYVYQFGLTKEISLKVEQQKAEICFRMNPLYSVEDLTSFKCRVFRDAFRKTFLIHVIKFDEGLEIKGIKIVINGKKYQVNKNVSNFPFMYSMLNGSNIIVPEKWKFTIVDYLIHSTKSGTDYDHINCAIQALLLGKSREFETDRLLNYWTSMNAVYNQLTRLYQEEYCMKIGQSMDDLPSSKRAYKFDNVGMGALIATLDPGVILPKKYDSDDNYKAAFRKLNGLFNDTILDTLDELYNESLTNFENDYDSESKYAELYELARNINLPLFFVLLLIYPYYLRCNYFHGSKVQPLVLAYNDVEFRDFRVCNYFLERFLDENIPDMLSQDWFTEEKYNYIENYLKKR